MAATVSPSPPTLLRHGDTVIRRIRCDHSRVAVPEFSIRVHVAGRGCRVDVPVVPAKRLVQVKHRCVAAEIEQPIQRALDVYGVTAARAQDGVHHLLIQPLCLLLQFVDALRQREDRLESGHGLWFSVRAMSCQNVNTISMTLA